MTEQSSAWREPVPLEDRVSALERNLSNVVANVALISEILGLIRGHLGIGMTAEIPQQK